MGSPNHMTWISKHKDNLNGPILEIGSKDYGNTENFRVLIEDGSEYVGVDMSAGKGVDLVLDLTLEFEEISRQLGGKRFGTIICLSVLEHCEQPFKMAENITRLLKDDGCVFISAPFSWRFHGYPSDYWRFSHEGIKKLFPKIAFDNSKCTLATIRKNEFIPIDEKMGRIAFRSKEYFKRGKYLRGLTAKLLGLLGKLGLLRWLLGYTYIMPPVEVMMFGNLDRQDS